MVSAVLALASRLLADPKPVKDAHQAEELAHILKTVRACLRLACPASLAWQGPRTGVRRFGPPGAVSGAARPIGVP